MSASIVASKSFTIYSVKKVPDMDDGLCQYPAFMSDIYLPPFLFGFLPQFENLKEPDLPLFLHLLKNKTGHDDQNINPLI